MARVLAFDYGTKRVGIAVTDPLKIIATPMQTLHPDEVIPFLKQYMTGEAVESFVIGIPRHMDGNLMADINKHIEQFRKKLHDNFPDIPVYEIDERFTSKIAQQSLVQSGLKKKDRQDKKKLDSVSATLILQTFLAQHP